MQRVTYTLTVDAPDGEPLAALRQRVEDALEGLYAQGGGVEYTYRGTAEGPPERQEPGLPQGVYRTGADL